MQKTNEPPQPTPDAVDRINEILRCAIDMDRNSLVRLSKLIDKLIGQNPPTPIDPIPRDADFPMSIAELLGELERAQSAISNQLDRLREFKV